MKALFLIIASTFLLCGKASAYCKDNSWCSNNQICERPTDHFGRSSSSLGVCVDDHFSPSRTDPWGRCSRQNDCRSNEFCDNGVCIEDEGGITCTFDNDCGPGFECQRFGTRRTCTWVGFEEENDDNNSNSGTTWPAPKPKPNEKKSTKKKKGRQYEAYNKCMRDNRTIKPVSKRIEKCQHLR